jgi:hypothetical protein
VVVAAQAQQQAQAQQEAPLVVGARKQGAVVQNASTLPKNTELKRNTVVKVS